MTPAVKLLSPFAAAALLFGAMPDSVLAAPPATTRVCKTHTHDGQGEHINIGEAKNKVRTAVQKSSTGSGGMIPLRAA